MDTILDCLGFDLSVKIFTLAYLEDIRTTCVSAWKKRFINACHRFYWEVLHADYFGSMYSTKLQRRLMNDIISGKITMCNYNPPNIGHRKHVVKSTEWMMSRGVFNYVHKMQRCRKPLKFANFMIKHISKVDDANNISTYMACTRILLDAVAYRAVSNQKMIALQNELNLDFGVLSYHNDV